MGNKWTLYQKVLALLVAVGVAITPAIISKTKKKLFGKEYSDEELKASKNIENVSEDYIENLANDIMYESAIEYFVENGIILTNSQLDALQEKYTDQQKAIRKKYSDDKYGYLNNQKYYDSLNRAYKSADYTGSNQERSQGSKWGLGKVGNSKVYKEKRLGTSQYNPSDSGLNTSRFRLHQMHKSLYGK